MTGIGPAVQARCLALRRRLALRLSGRFDPYPPPPEGAALSPSAAHVAALDGAPLRLSWPHAVVADPVAWQDTARVKFAEFSSYRRASVIWEARVANKSE